LQMKTWLEQVESYRVIPMSRSACDFPVPCPFRAICYSPDPSADIEGIGIYKRKNPLKIIQ
jgi:hypothetical protein